MKQKNRLKDETSPYLLQHAENPVDWYPWCEEAFEKARKEDKPVFLSIGYSTCHWCHVMAKESFEDEDVARRLNRDFISIKVDREERPDLDTVYMTACIALTGSGGWPMSLFLTAEKKPFFAGTYFPKQSRHGMMGFLDLLSAVAEGWKTRRKEMLNGAEALMHEMKTQQKLNPAAEPLQYSGGRTLIRQAVSQLKRSFDQEHGGFGMAPKFPMPQNLLFLIQQYTAGRDETLRPLFEKTLLQMYKGGLYDHLGGGFSRYSTDKYFLVPHFEKMLYDNALLILAYSRAFEATGDRLFLNVAEGAAAWILREMQGAQGGFYSSQDADSEGKEGKYYTFSADEIIRLLGGRDGAAFCSHYGITERGNFEGSNIPNLLAHENPEEVDAVLRERMYQYRKKRYHLHTDDKILTAWNGMAVCALAELYQKTEKKAYLQAAERAVRFLLGQLGDDGDYSALFVSWRAGRTGEPGFTDDYAWMISSFLSLFEATRKKEYLDKARRFMRRALRNFFDGEQGGFTFWGRQNEPLILNPKETHDGAVPSGNSVMVYNLVKLVHYVGDGADGDAFEAAAEKQITFMAAAAKSYPAGHCFFLLALSLWLDSSSFYVCRDGVCGLGADSGVQDGMDGAVREEEVWS